MIYTVTFNPSLDYIVDVDDFQTGMVNRASREFLFLGGKGINVSIVLHNLGTDCTNLGFVAGFTGDEITRQLSELQIKQRFITLPEGASRINVKLRSAKESEINGLGPTISQHALHEFFQILETLTSEDIVVLAGSIPTSLPDTIYHDIMKRLAPRKVSVVVDATRTLLYNVLELHPFLIKPNHYELAELFHTEAVTDPAVIISNCKKLQEAGARNVLISMAGEGAILVTEHGEIFQTAAPKGTVVNSVGAGDSMVAGFLHGYLETGDYKTAFYQGVSCGSASAFSERLATKEEMEQLYQQILSDSHQ